MEISKTLLQFIQEGRVVLRYHTRPGARMDTIGHHSHGVAILCGMLMPNVSSTLLLSALYHDMGEQKYGDMSAPAKRCVPGLGDQLRILEHSLLTEYDVNYEQRLNEHELLVLKFADCFDGMLYCCSELSFGNMNALLVWRRYCAYIETITGVDVPIELALRASALYESIKEIYREVRSETGPNFDVFTKQ